jgi:hypothetical protein
MRLSANFVLAAEVLVNTVVSAGPLSVGRREDLGNGMVLLSAESYTGNLKGIEHTGTVTWWGLISNSSQGRVKSRSSNIIPAPNWCSVSSVYYCDPLQNWATHAAYDLLQSILARVPTQCHTRESTKLCLL